MQVVLTLKFDSSSTADPLAPLLLLSFSSPLSSTMSDALYQKVDRLFSLLDLDSNGSLDRSEARLGFLACFDEVHREREAADMTATEKAAVVDKQVAWLFAATAHDDDSRGVSIAEFRTCYSNLLKGAYEEEVLLLDLQRAIAGLEGAAQWSLAKRVLDTTNQIYRALSASAEEQGQAAAAAVSLADARASAALHRMFLHITGRSQVLGPKRQTQARKIVAPLFGEAAPAPPAFGAAPAAASSAAAPAAASASAAVSVTLPQLIRVVKELLALPVPGESLAEDVDAALLIATGAAPADGAASSSSAAAPAHMES